jgi:GDP-L-fucose synthase
VHASESGEIPNVGSGAYLTIKELATRMAAIVCYRGSITWDVTMPNGTPCKVVDISKLSQTDWRTSTEWHDGIGLTYE